VEFSSPTQFSRVFVTVHMILVISSLISLYSYITNLSTFCPLHVFCVTCFYYYGISVHIHAL